MVYSSLAQAGLLLTEAVQRAEAPHEINRVNADYVTTW